MNERKEASPKQVARLLHYIFPEKYNHPDKNHICDIVITNHGGQICSGD